MDVGRKPALHVQYTFLILHILYLSDLSRIRLSASARSSRCVTRIAAYRASRPFASGHWPEYTHPINVDVDIDLNICRDGDRDPVTQ